MPCPENPTPVSSPVLAVPQKRRGRPRLPGKMGSWVVVQKGAKTVEVWKSFPLVVSWHAMIARCHNKNAADFHRYGGRGISVCEHLRATPWNLMALIGDRPKDMTLDRVNNAGNYTCGHCAECRKNSWEVNVRWADKFTQCNNRRSNLVLEFNGKTQTAVQWAAELGLPPQAIYRRVQRFGWSVEEALSTPRLPTGITRIAKNYLTIRDSQVMLPAKTEQ